MAGPRRSIPISALEHHAYCPRQAALIHVEGYFDRSVDTVRGDLAHAAVDRGGSGAGPRTVRSLPVWNERIGLHGVCDVVEFGDGAPMPIEHKSGAYRRGGPADVQVAAQAMCLQEMFDLDVPVGIVFSGRDRRRHEVAVDHDLVRRVEHTTRAVRDLLERAELPAPVQDSRCRRCSLRPGCLPEAPMTSVADLFVPRPLGTWDD